MRTKDSGIEWIGEIPEEWIVTKVKHKYKFDTGFTPDTSHSEYYLDDDGYEWATIADLQNGRVTSPTKSLISKEYVNLFHKKQVPAGCLLYSFKLSVGQTAYTDRPLFTNEAIACFYPSENNNLNYLKYSSCLIEYNANTNIYGAKIMNQQTIQNAYITFPPLEVQDRIVKYLDEKCSKIDGILSDIQSQIETLVQYKNSVITEAVTKGLDKSVDFKDSGTPWCPRIPIHWEKTNPKALFSQRFDRAADGDRQLTASQEYGIVYQDDYMDMTGNRVVTVAKDFSILKRVEPGDFVISMRSFQGGLEYSELSGCISSAYVMLIPNKKLVYPPFYRWFFKSSKYINAIQSTSNLVRDGQAMRYANFVQVPLFVIPIDEQKQIAEYLDNKVEKIDTIIKIKQEQLEILEKHKKSMIYECVTGKREVPA